MFLSNQSTYSKAETAIRYGIFSGNSSMRSIEIRVGFEKPSNSSDPRYLNTFCGFISDTPNTNSSNVVTYFNIGSAEFVNVTVNCSQGTLRGRYITIQKRECGQLELREVTFLPNPSK